jgi:hypothetical protein
MAQSAENGFGDYAVTHRQAVSLDINGCNQQWLTRFREGRLQFMREATSFDA